MPFYKGMKFTKEHRKKLSLAKRGCIPWNKNTKRIVCRICKTIFEVPPSRKKKAKFCSYECKRKGMLGLLVGKENPKWKGGRCLELGYVSIRKPTHPFSRSNGRVAEHRLVMEKHLGRYLHSKEIVHHIDGNRANNKLNNLMLFPSNSAHRKFHKFLERKKHTENR